MSIWAFQKDFEVIAYSNMRLQLLLQVLWQIQALQEELD